MDTDINNTTLHQLRKDWMRVFKTNPPPFAHAQFLQNYLFWEEQKRSYGGFKKQTLQTLKKQREALRAGVQPKPLKSLEIKPGIKFIREHQGVRHQVISQQNGYLYQDKIYRSLSAIAREITGTQWNGKLFFGVKS